MIASAVEAAAIAAHNGMDRRRFVAAASAAWLGSLVPSGLHARSAPAPRRMATPVRVRGVVAANGRGIERVAVSDGIQVVDTAAGGSFELVTTTERPFVFISVPSGYRIPRGANGTARCYRSLAADTGGDLSADFELQPLTQSDERHAFLVLADIQTQDTDEVRWFHEQTVPDVRHTVADLGVEAFGLAWGDIVYDHLELFSGYETGVSNMGLPCFQVVGNHDEDYSSVTDHGSTVTFSRHFGPPYYSFNRGAVHYVVLDDVFWYGSGYLGYLSHEQLTWLEQDLARVDRGAPVVVAVHIPIMGSRYLREGRRSPEIGSSVTNRGALYRLLEPFEAHIVSGHMHECEHVFDSGVHEQVNGAVSGAWWSGPICGDGAPSGYSVYEVDGQSISWRYKATGQSADYQLRTYVRGADPAAPDEIVANVWNWDPAWSVVWYEDGVRKGPMSRRTGRDPLSVELHSGPDLPARRTWVDPYPTAHLFYAPVTPKARSVRVETTDRFGRVYSAEVPPAPSEG